MEYKIEVLMEPYYHTPNKASYFWCILGLSDGTWCNYGHGWQDTPEQAWTEANKILKLVRKS